MEFSQNGFSVVVQKYQYESDEMFFDRGWFIVSQIDDKTDNLDEIVKLSKVWSNMKYMNCRYSHRLFKKVEEMSKRINC